MLALVAFAPASSAAVALNPLDARSLLTGLGVLGVFVVMFAETGLLIGFFLPGDSLLFTAGILSATAATNPAHLPLGPVIIAAAAGAILGSHLGYLIGRRGGRALLRRTRNRHLHHGVERASVLIGRYGHGKAITLARFIPVVRTVLNPLAGTIGVPLRTFTRWQLIGGLLWTIGLCCAGYLIGNSVPNIDHYLLSIVAVIVLVSLTPLAIEAYRVRKAHRSGEQPPTSWHR
jgi:membrane-associated protein